MLINIAKILWTGGVEAVLLMFHHLPSRYWNDRYCVVKRFVEHSQDVQLSKCMKKRVNEIHNLTVGIIFKVNNRASSMNFIISFYSVTIVITAAFIWLLSRMQIWKRVLLDSKLSSRLRNLCDFSYCFTTTVTVGPLLYFRSKLHGNYNILPFFPLYLLNMTIHLKKLLAFLFLRKKWYLSIFDECRAVASSFTVGNWKFDR